MCPFIHCSRNIAGSKRNGSHLTASSTICVLFPLQTVHGNLFSLSLGCLGDELECPCYNSVTTDVHTSHKSAFCLPLYRSCTQESVARGAACNKIIKIVGEIIMVGQRSLKSLVTCNHLGGKRRAIGIETTGLKYT